MTSLPTEQAIHEKIRNAQIEHMRRHIRERLAEVEDKLERGIPLSDEPPEQKKNG